MSADAAPLRALAEVRGSGTLEEVFIRTVGEDRAPAQGLSWLADGRRAP